MIILVVNAGSSSLKYQLINSIDGEVYASGNCERIGIAGSKITYKRPDKADFEPLKIVMDLSNHSVAMEKVISLLADKEVGCIKSMDQIDAVGHRVLHGGEKFAGSYVINKDVIEAIKDCIPLGPLHNPANLAGIEACQKAMPGKPQVAVFDTAFHQTMPEEAYMYALPYSYYEDYGVRRYGFHGTSHQYVSQEAAKALGRPAESLKIITCHLGNGSSLAAVKYGKCVDTSMGLTPLAGVPMGTRCGDIDPAVIKYVMEEDPSLTIKDIDRIMNKESGVLGISGVSSDFRDLAQASEQGNQRAALALKMFAYHVKKYIGSYAAAMGGVDAVVFTAGIGENTPEIREAAVEGLGFMGIKVDPAKNLSCNRVGGDISAADATVKVLVIPTNEELMIARETERLTKQA
ncbi:acetate kinase [Oscillospiraceae bacterium HV4-5-C5C]|nr:acetate kinase [Oscillospiraceae bacterium HV4-5-C5C]